jgi:hypothetical protein
VGLTREAFLTRWRAFTIEDPRAAFEQVGWVGRRVQGGWDQGGDGVAGGVGNLGARGCKAGCLDS